MSRLLIGLPIVLIFLGTASAQDGIEFRPYDPAAPAATVSGSIRGAEGDLSILLLAPTKLAVTSVASPVLYWHASGGISDPVELVLIEEGGVEPLVETVLEPPLAAGLHEFALPSDVELAIGTVYQWSVSIIPDPDARSNDIFSSALMQRVEYKSRSEPGGGVEAARLLARDGLWYDTLMALNEARSSDPDANRLWRKLLEQTGLDAIK